MALFKRKKDNVLDLTDRYRKQLDAQTRKAAMESTQQTNASGFGFLGDMASAQQLQGENVNDSAEEKRRKLAKRISEMTNKIEEISNQIYHLQQRVEVLERKAGVKIE